MCLYVEPENNLLALARLDDSPWGSSMMKLDAKGATKLV